MGLVLQRKKISPERREEVADITIFEVLIAGEQDG